MNFIEIRIEYTAIVLFLKMSSANVDHFVPVTMTFYRQLIVSRDAFSVHAVLLFIVANCEP